MKSSLCSLCTWRELLSYPPNHAYVDGVYIHPIPSNAYTRALTHTFKCDEMECVGGARRVVMTDTLATMSFSRSPNGFSRFFSGGCGPICPSQTLSITCTRMFNRKVRNAQGALNNVLPGHLS